MRKEDEFLIQRLREMMQRRKGYSEKKMFGGICFMINGNMCVGPWKGFLIVRLDINDHDSIQAEPYVKPMDITGKVMKGWAMVEPDGIQTDEALRAWVERAVDFARTLPAK
ncbi:MAG: TfoX/Sxy family protein [Planctomycetales bacterium]|nr:TfoX/Sxy family protein [Planctomycetales bacterium]